MWAKFKSSLMCFFNWDSGGVESSWVHSALQRPIVTAPGDYNDGEIVGMIDRVNRSTRRQPALVPLCPPQNPHAARKRTRVAAVGSQRITVFFCVNEGGTYSYHCALSETISLLGLACIAL
jgi:hypothetical protein